MHSAESLALTDDAHLSTGPARDGLLAFGRPDGIWEGVLGKDGEGYAVFHVDMV